MGQFAAIRRDHPVDGLSIRALADRHGVHWRTVRQSLESAIPPSRKTPLRIAPRLEPFKTAIDAMLRSDLDAPKKQRHTARRIWARLLDEHGAAGLSYSTVRDHVRKRRPQILAEAGRPLELGYVPQTHQPAAFPTAREHSVPLTLTLTSRACSACEFVTDVACQVCQLMNRALVQMPSSRWALPPR